MAPHSVANGKPAMAATAQTRRPVMVLMRVRTTMYLRSFAAATALPSSRTRAASPSAIARTLRAKSPTSSRPSIT